MTSRLLSPLPDDCRRYLALKYAKLLNNHCVLLGIIVCTITGISSAQLLGLVLSTRVTYITQPAPIWRKIDPIKAVRVILYRFDILVSKHYHFLH